MSEHSEENPARERLTRLAAVSAVAAVAIAVIVVATGAGSDAPPRLGSARAIATKLTIDRLLTGIPEQGNALGQPTAPVTLTWFGDLECPYCRQFALGALTPIIQKWVRSGRLRIEYRSMKTATRQREVFRKQQLAALAAGMQNRLWYFVELFYHEQGEEDSGYVTESYLHGLASQIPGLNVELWAEDRHDPALAGEVAADVRAARTAGFHGTPSFLFGKTGGAMKPFEYTSLSEPGAFEEEIELLL